jgi:hypothetical protein
MVKQILNYPAKAPEAPGAHRGPAYRVSSSLRACNSAAPMGQSTAHLMQQASIGW